MFSGGGAPPAGYPPPYGLYGFDPRIVEAQRPRSRQERDTVPKFTEGKLFIGGVEASNISKDELVEYCSTWGEVKDAVVMDRKGYGFVTFADPKAAMRFLEKGEHELKGRRLDAKASVPKAHLGTAKLTRKMFVGGTGHLTDEDLQSHFGQYGDIQDVAVVKREGQSRGFGFVTFADEVSVEKCLLVNHVIAGRKVELKRAVPKEDVLMAQQAGSMQLPGGGHIQPGQQLMLPPPPQFYPAPYAPYALPGPAAAAAAAAAAAGAAPPPALGAPPLPPGVPPPAARAPGGAPAAAAPYAAAAAAAAAAGWPYGGAPPPYGLPPFYGHPPLPHAGLAAYPPPPFGYPPPPYGMLPPFVPGAPGLPPHAAAADAPRQQAGGAAAAGGEGSSSSQRAGQGAHRSGRRNGGGSRRPSSDAGGSASSSTSSSQPSAQRRHAQAQAHADSPAGPSTSPEAKGSSQQQQPQQQQQQGPAPAPPAAAPAAAPAASAGDTPRPPVVISCPLPGVPPAIVAGGSSSIHSSTLSSPGVAQLIAGATGLPPPGFHSYASAAAVRASSQQPGGGAQAMQQQQQGEQQSQQQPQQQAEQPSPPPRALAAAAGRAAEQPREVVAQH